MISVTNNQAYVSMLTSSTPREMRDPKSIRQLLYRQLVESTIFPSCSACSLHYTYGNFPNIYRQSTLVTTLQECALVRRAMTVFKFSFANGLSARDSAMDVVRSLSTVVHQNCCEDLLRIEDKHHTSIQIASIYMLVLSDNHNLWTVTYRLLL